MIGYCDLNSARAGYLINFTPGWKGLGTIDETTIKGLRNWLTHGDTQAPYEPPIQIGESKMESLVEELMKAPSPKKLKTEGKARAVVKADGGALTLEYYPESIDVYMVGRNKERVGMSIPLNSQAYKDFLRFCRIVATGE
jgi:hypothetical protein